uniref:hypothetical protein n=1 Tax=Segatella baroniae TaxID=305719 RepID=UPI001EE2621A|nr:hypothetical protein [Segatella baroniae]
MDNANAAAANAYILQDDGLFHKVTTEYPAAVVPIYRAYITCPKARAPRRSPSSSTARPLALTA